MDRRNFIKLASAFPLFFVGREAQSFQVPTPPVSKSEVILLDTLIAGWQYHQGDLIWQKLCGETALTLRREPLNPYDENAIAVHPLGVKLGDVPQIHNTVIAGLIDQGLPVKACVLKKHKAAPPWEKMEIRLTMEV